MTHSAWIALASLSAMLFINVAVVAFMLGRLSQRVSTLERDGSALQGLRDAVTTLTVQMKDAKDDIAHLLRDMASLQRQLSNLMADRGDRLVELPPNVPPGRRRRQGGGS